MKKILPYLVLALLVFGGLKFVEASEVKEGTLNPGLETGISGVNKSAPIASPAAGDYHTNQSVTLEALGSTAICYTDDGTTPACATSATCTTGTKYSSAISLSSSKTIKSVGCYGDGSQGPAGSAAYTFSCTTATVSNGSVSAYPTCAVSCNSGYTVSGSSCASSGALSSGGGGGGGGYTAPAMPTTTTGQVTATAVSGGKTSLVTSESTAVTATLAANAVSSNTIINVAEIGKTSSEAATAVASLPGLRVLVGNSIYNFTATRDGALVTNFNQNITLTFTYTDAQIAGLSESSLQVFYWNDTTSSWAAMATTINADTNTLTVLTNHFTKFAVLGSATGGQDTVAADTTTPTGQTIAEGALIRAIGDIDIYIVKYVGAKQFKRLILSPSVFNSYQHLRWGDVKDVAQSVVDSFTTSELVRAVGDPKVYKLYPAGDTGQKRWIKTAAGFNRMGFDWDAVYEINTVDRNSYTTGIVIE